MSVTPGWATRRWPRSAQLALKHLVESGAIVTHRVGRNVEYRLEDTTFKEPTQF